MKLSSHYRITVITIVSSLLTNRIAAIGEGFMALVVPISVNVDPFRQWLWWRPRR
jgi:hypothetical protein